MPIRRDVRFLLVAAPILFAACGRFTSSAANADVRPAGDAPATEGRRAAPLDTSAWVDSTLASLTLRQRVAQLVVFWTLGDYTAIDDSTFAEIVQWVEQEGV